ncbi:MAG: IS3 family transposase [Betaproteobacteria bacterium]|nr:MAG: IS3 family transposase [Betaproteobacteria bacterium]
MAFLCERYKVSRSGFYAWDARERSRRSRDDEQLRARIERIHRDSRGRYGSPRVHEQLKREGVRCSNKRVARLMREQGLRARVSSLYRRSTGVHRFFEKTGNARLELPAPIRIDQIWVGDVTYLRLGKHWRYLATVMDLFSRRIIGWTIACNRTTEVTLRALKRAIALRSPKPGLLFHSDRGIEYSAYGYQAFLRARGFVPSMNRPRNCQDNAHMESFFHSLKAELVHQNRFTNDAQLNATLGGYIERFYNIKRMHSSLGYHSPVEFERLANA